MKKQAYGVSRSRDRKGKIVHQELKPYTICIHANAGAGWETMQVLVMEKIEYENQDPTGDE